MSLPMGHLKRPRLPAMSWRRLGAPRPAPAEAAETVWVDNAILTPLATGEMRVVDRHWRWVSGAVYDSAGHLVPASQRQWDRTVHQPVAVDPPVVRVPGNVARTLEGPWVFGGHWARHFGHFLLETLPNLWPEEALGTRGIVMMESAFMRREPNFQRGLFVPQLRPWQEALLELAGFGGHELQVSCYKTIRAERLLVPERPVFLNQWVRPEAVGLWRRISDAVGARGSATKVFLSRTRFNSDEGTSATGALRTDPEWDALLDSRFAGAGFAVVNPEELSIPEQIELVRGAGVIAGSSGSALHLSCFADPGTRIVEVGDLRTGGEPLRMQRAIDAACGHWDAYIGYADTDALAGLEALLDTDPGAPEPAPRLADRLNVRRLAAGLRRG